MSTQFDVPSLYEFLTQTPEGGLKKMLVDGKPLTDVHFNLLIKVVKFGSQDDFTKFCETKNFPPVRLTPKELPLKEKFWDDCLKVFQSRGILQPSSGNKTAA